jgi:hypothetical protein
VLCLDLLGVLAGQLRSVWGLGVEGLKRGFGRSAEICAGFRGWRAGFRGVKGIAEGFWQVSSDLRGV